MSGGAKAEFVMWEVSGHIETTTKAQQAMMFTDQESAEKLARRLGHEWFAVKWEEIK